MNIDKSLQCTYFFFLLILTVLSRSISDNYTRGCGFVTCSRPQRTGPRLKFKPPTSGTRVIHSTPAPVRSTRQRMTLNGKSKIKMRAFRQITQRCWMIRLHTLELSLAWGYKMRSIRAKKNKKKQQQNGKETNKRIVNGLHDCLNWKYGT